MRECVCVFFCETSMFLKMLNVMLKHVFLCRVCCLHGGTVCIPCTDAPVCHNVSQCFKSDTIICHQRPKILINAASRKKWD